MNNVTHVEAFIRNQMDRLKPTSLTASVHLSQLEVTPFSGKDGWRELFNSRMKLIDSSSILLATTKDPRWASSSLGGQPALTTLSKVLGYMAELPWLSRTPQMQSQPISESILVTCALACLVRCKVVSMEAAILAYINLFPNQQEFPNTLGDTPVEHKFTNNVNTVLPVPAPDRVYSPTVYTPAVVEDLLRFTPPNVHGRDELTALLIDLVAADLVDEHRVFTRISELRGTAVVQRREKLSDHAGADVHQVFAQAIQGGKLAFLDPSNGWTPGADQETFAREVEALLSGGDIDATTLSTDPSLPIGGRIVGDTPLTKADRQRLVDRADACKCGHCLELLEYAAKQGQVPSGQSMDRQMFLDFLRESAERAQQLPAFTQGIFGQSLGDAANDSAERNRERHITKDVSELCQTGRIVSKQLTLSKAAQEELIKITDGTDYNKTASTLEKAYFNINTSAELKDAIQTLLGITPERPSFFNVLSSLTKRLQELKPQAQRITVSQAVKDELLHIINSAQTMYVADAFKDAIATGTVSKETQEAIGIILEMQNSANPNKLTGIQIVVEPETPKEEAPVKQGMDLFDSLTSDNGKFMRMEHQQPLNTVEVTPAVREELNTWLARRNASAATMLLNALCNDSVSDEAKEAIKRILDTPEFAEQLKAIAEAQRPETEQPTPQEYTGVFAGRSIQQIAEVYDQEMAEYRARVMADVPSAKEDVSGYMSALRDTQRYASYIIDALGGIDYLGNPTTDLELEILKAHLRTAVNKQQMTLKHALNRLHKYVGYLNDYRATAEACKQAVIQRQEAEAKRLDDIRAKITDFVNNSWVVNPIELTTAEQLDNWLLGRSDEIRQLRATLQADLKA